MDKIQLTATFPAIDPADLSAFKELAAESIELVRSEPGTLQYDWFFSEDERRCVVRETYADSEAVLAHVDNVGAIVEQIVPLGGGLELELFGTPSPELAAGLRKLAPAIHPFFAGK